MNLGWNKTGVARGKQPGEKEGRRKVIIKLNHGTSVLVWLPLRIMYLYFFMNQPSFCVALSVLKGLKWTIDRGAALFALLIGPNPTC
jgi:hypothetical protein